MNKCLGKNMDPKLRWVKTASLLLCGWFLLGFKASQAQIAFEPNPLTLELKPGQASEYKVKVFNHSAAAKKLAFSLEYRRGALAGVKIHEWVYMAPVNLDLKPGEAGTVYLKIKRPNGALKGECVLSLFAAELIQRQQIPLTVRVGMPIFVLWDGSGRALDGIVAGCRKTDLGKNEIQLEVEVLNRGWVHLAPFGIAWVEDRAGKKLWQVELRPDQPIFPGERKTIVWRGKGLPPGAHHPGDVLGVQVFMGSLYGLQSLGIPRRAELKMPFKLEAKK